MQENKKAKWYQTPEGRESAWKNVKAGAFILCMVAALITAGIMAKREIFKDHYRHYTQYMVYQETNKLVHDSIKLELIREVDRYIGEATQNTSALDGLVVVDNCIKYGIDICFVLAQGEQESHFGTQGLARKTNSVFNVFAFDGHSYNAINKNGKYQHPNDCVEPYLRLLERDYLVEGKTEYDLLTNYVNKNGARYASSDGYEKRLVSKITKIRENTRIDALYQELKKQRLIVGM